MQTILDDAWHTEKSVVALGMFDGVHIGHQVLLQKARALADQRGVPLVVSTFMEHPLRLVAPEKCPPLLTTFDERAKRMEALGVDVLYAMPFDKKVADMPPEDYVGQLVRRFHPTDVVCGYNHTFGRRGEGTPALFTALGGALGFATAVVPKITLDGAEVSSSAIREALSRGQVDTARRLLGRPYGRQAAVAQRVEKRWELCMTPNGKQDVPHGAYRALCDDGRKRYPVTLKVLREGRAVCALAANAELHDEVYLHFLTNLSIDF